MAKIIFYSFCWLTILSSFELSKCCQPTTAKLYTDVVDLNVYKKIITPDTANCRYYKKSRKVIASLQNAKAIVEMKNSICYFRIGDFKMWACELPEEALKKNVGDSVVLTGRVYNILGDELLVGHPAILKEIRLKK